MKVYNELKTEELSNYNLEEGYLKQDVLIYNIPEVKEVKEVSHIEPIDGYKNCYKTVIDVKAVKGIPAHTEKEKIYVFIPYTEEEKQRKLNDKKIANLKNWFDKNYRYYSEKLTRFEALDIVEGVIDNIRGKTYSSLIELYQEAENVRKEINDLEL